MSKDNEPRPENAEERKRGRWIGKRRGRGEGKKREWGGGGEGERERENSVKVWYIICKGGLNNFSHPGTRFPLQWDFAIPSMCNVCFFSSAIWPGLIT